MALAFASLAFVCYHTSVALTWYHNPARSNPEGHVVILTTSWCPFCLHLKTALDSANMPYVEIDVERDWRAELAFQSTNRHGVPVTIIGDTVVEGGLQKQIAAIRQTCERHQQPPGAVNCAKIE